MCVCVCVCVCGTLASPFYLEGERDFDKTHQERDFDITHQKRYVDITHQELCARLRQEKQELRDERLARKLNAELSAE